MSIKPSLLDEIDQQGSRLAKAEADLYDLTTALSYAFDGTAKMDEKGNYVYVNDLYAANFGYTTENLQGLPWNVTVLAEYRETMTEAIEFCKIHGRITIEAKGLRKDGSVFWKRVSLVRIPPGTDKVYTGYYAFVRDITDSKQWATELQKSEQRFSTLVRSTSNIVWVRDVHGDFSENQPSWEAFTGQTRKEYEGLGWMGAVREDDKIRVAEAWSTALMNSSNCEIEYSLRRHDGVYRDMHSRSTPVLEKDGSIREWIGASEDVTEENLTRQRFYTLTNAMAQIVWTTNSEGIVDYYNDRWYEYTGINPQDKFHWETRCHPDDLPMILEHQAMHRDPVTMYQFEFRLLGADKSYRWFLARCVPIQDTDKDTLYWIGTSTDINEQKLDKERYEISEIRKNAILDAALDPIITIEANSTIIEWNKASETVFGYTQEEAIGAILPDLIIPKNYYNKYNFGIEKYLETGESALIYTTFEIPAIRKDKQLLNVEISIIPINTGGNQLFTAYIRDITDKKNNAKILNLREKTLAAAANGIVITDCTLPDEPIIYCNPAFEKITGYGKDETLGRNCRFLQGPDTDKSSVKKIQDAVKNRKPCRVNLLNYRKDGTTFWNDLTISPVLDDNGDCTNYIGVQYETDSNNPFITPHISHDTIESITHESS